MTTAKLSPPAEINVHILSKMETKLLYQLWEIFCKYPAPPLERKRFVKALICAYQLHTSTRRKSGESYFIHDLRCAIRMLLMGTDLTMAIIMLCHEFMEDDGWTLGRMREEFGVEITTAVVAISKPPKSFGNSQVRLNRHIKIMLTTILKNNYRPLLAKAVDRHDNCRDTAGLSSYDLGILFSETQEVFLPLFIDNMYYIPPHLLYFYRFLVFEIEYACANYYQARQ